jgi:nucleoside-diphosphate-sugar epimerase
MKILVIGGTRFFGKRFVQMLIDQGHSVTILSRGQTSDPFKDTITRITSDRTDPDQLRKAIRSEYDVVVDNMLMNANEAHNIVSLLRDRTSHFVMTSTLSVYDPQVGEIFEKDFQAMNHVEMTDGIGDYQEGKRAAEKVLAVAPFDVSIMRIPLIVGPDDYTQRLLNHIRVMQNDDKIHFPNLAAKFSYLHAKDAARALSWLCNERITGTFNISSPTAWSLRELMDLIGQVINKRFVNGEPSDPHSPFGIAENYYMNTDKAQSAGFKVDPLDSWLPELLQDLSRT